MKHSKPKKRFPPPQKMEEIKKTLSVLIKFIYLPMNLFSSGKCSSALSSTPKKVTHNINKVSCAYEQPSENQSLEFCCLLFHFSSHWGSMSKIKGKWKTEIKHAINKTLNKFKNYCDTTDLQSAMLTL